MIKLYVRCQIDFKEVGRKIISTLVPKLIHSGLACQLAKSVEDWLPLKWNWSELCQDIG